jgi:chorismate mutase
MQQHKFTIVLTEREQNVIEKYLSRPVANKDAQVVADLLDKLYEVSNEYFMSVS